MTLSINVDEFVRAAATCADNRLSPLASKNSKAFTSETTSHHRCEVSDHSCAVCHAATCALAMCPPLDNDYQRNS
eukprot:4864574-Amphidinium_carterae.1